MSTSGPKLSASSRGLGSLFLAMALLQLLTAVIIYLATARSNGWKDRLAGNQTIIFQIERVLSTLRDAETGQRGYIITGKDSYLVPYTAALLQLQTDRNTLAEVAARRPEETGNIAEINGLLDAKLAELKETIDIRREISQEKAMDRIMSGEGKSKMDQLRVKIGDLEQAANAEIDLDRQSATSAVASRNAVLGAALVLNLAFILWAGRRAIRESRSRAAAAATLAHQKELLAVTLASIGDGVITTDRFGQVAFMNAIAEALTGWTLAECRGGPLGRIFRIINEDSRAPVENPVEKVLREGIIVGLANHTLLIRKDGSEIPIDDSGAPIRAGDGTMQGVVMVFRDFSAQKQSEEAIKRGAERLRLTVDAAELGTFYCAMPLNKIEWNDKCKEHFFLPADAQIDFDVFYSRIHPDDRQRTRQAIDHAMKDNVVYDVEYRTMGPAGAIRWVRAMGRFFYDGHGTPTRFDGVTIDITAHKDAQEQLQKAKTEAEQASQAKDQFVAALSHELRTPLTPVLATLTSWESDDGLPEAVRADVQMLRRNVELEARLIDDLLDLTRVVKGKLILNLEDVDMHDVLQQVLRICSSETHARSIRVALKLEARDFWVHGDSARLQQILWNILRNAAKFSDKNTEVIITTSNTPDGKLRIEVHDEGIGIDAATAARIFNPFVQGDASITRRFGGLGMGLAISKALVDLQGGSLSVMSQGLGHGSTFSVVLPASTRPHPEAKDSGSAQPVLVRRALRILLVEDHEDTARTMTRLLGTLDHVVTLAGTVKEALAAAHAGTFDLVISDLGLPDATGIAFMEQLRAFCNTPAIALTGFGMDEDIARTRAAGFNAHLTKPVNFLKLETLMYQLVAKE